MPGTIGSYVIDDPTSVEGMVTIPVASNCRDGKEKVAVIEMHWLE
jgi:hypothetical protein